MLQIVACFQANFKNDSRVTSSFRMVLNVYKLWRHQDCSANNCQRSSVIVPIIFLRILLCCSSLEQVIVCWSY